MVNGDTNLDKKGCSMSKCNLKIGTKLKYIGPTEEYIKNGTIVSVIELGEHSFKISSDEDNNWYYSSLDGHFQLVTNSLSKIISVEKKITIKIDGYRKTITEEQARQLIDELIEATQ